MVFLPTVLTVAPMAQVVVRLCVCLSVCLSSVCNVCVAAKRYALR